MVARNRPLVFLKESCGRIYFISVIFLFFSLFEVAEAISSEMKNKFENLTLFRHLKVMAFSRIFGLFLKVQSGKKCDTFLSGTECHSSNGVGRCVMKMIIA